MLVLSRNGEVNELIHNQSLHIGLPPNGSQAVIDVSLPSSPVFAPGYMLIPVKGAPLPPPPTYAPNLPKRAQRTQRITGEVFLASGLHSNYTPTPIPALATNQMLQLSVGQYLFDTAGTALHVALRAPSENLPLHQSGPRLLIISVQGGRTTSRAC